MKYRDIEPFLERRFYLECAGRLDVFEVDTTECGLQGRDNFNQLFRILFIDFNIENIDISKLFEQYALAFHHRLGRQWPNIAQAQYGRPIADDSDQVTPGGYFAHGRRVFINQLACGRYTGRICQ